MKKGSVNAWILYVVIAILLIILIFGVFQGIKVKKIISDLQDRNSQLEQDRAQISQDKESVMSQLEQCRTQSQADHSKLNIMIEDWSKIQKTCMTDNVCKGKFSFMRYTCNAQGDTVDNGDKICQCDQNCNLVVS